MTEHVFVNRKASFVTARDDFVTCSGAPEALADASVRRSAPAVAAITFEYARVFGRRQTEWSFFDHSV